MSTMPNTSPLNPASQSIMHHCFSAIVLTCCCGLPFLTGCQNTEFYERERLTDPIMNLAGSATEVHFYQKSYYSREGSVGGFGSSAGGGCGCY